MRIEGKDIYLGFFGTKESKAEYDRIISEWLSNGRHLPQAENNQRTMTVDAVCDAYLDYAEGYYRKNGKVRSDATNAWGSVSADEKGNGRVLEHNVERLDYAQRLLIPSYVQDGLTTDNF